VVAVFAVCSFDIEMADAIDKCLSQIAGLRAFFTYSDPRSTGVYYDRSRSLNRFPDRPPSWGEGVYREELTAWHTLGRWPTLVGPTSFLQVNDEMAERLYRRMLDLPYGGPGEAVDAYCGVGILTRALADKFEKVTGIEFDAQSIKLARTTARRLQDCRVAWIAEAAEAVFGEWKQKSSKQSGCKPDLVVLDPPRKGCQREVLQALNILRPKDVVYISCHPAALARDLKILCDRQFAVVRVEPFDLFPQTHHVETLVHLKS
jgi:23S rRNA (uracil1939-C5)-methyltransferase